MYSLRYSWNFIIGDKYRYGLNVNALITGKTRIRVGVILNFVLASSSHFLFNPWTMAIELFECRA